MQSIVWSADFIDEGYWSYSLEWTETNTVQIIRYTIYNQYIEITHRWLTDFNVFTKQWDSSAGIISFFINTRLMAQIQGFSEIPRMGIWFSGLPHVS